MKTIKKLFVYLLPLVILGCGSCDVFNQNEKTIEITILSQKLDNKGKYPDEIVSLLSPLKHQDCGDTTVKTSLKLIRIDLPNKMDPKPLEIPRSSMENLLGATDDQEKIKDKLSKESVYREFIEPNGLIDEVKLQTLIKQFGGEKNIIGYNIDNSFSAGEDGIKFYSNFEQLKNDLSKRICNTSNNKFLILYNLVSNSTSQLRTDENPTIGLSTTSLTDNFSKELQIALMNIIAKRSTGEKLQLAKQLNEQYFNSQCIVKSYQSLTNPNVFDTFGSENGGLQYLQYLSTVTSIVDIQIQKVEKDKQTGKIVALYIYEKHN